MAGIIPDDKVEQVRLASDIVDVVSRYLNLKKSGRNYFGLCPFHKEKSPSFSVNQEKQIYHCFGCGEGGNVFNFVMRMEGLSFPESIRLLAKQAGIDLPETEGDMDQYRQKEGLYHANGMAAAFYLDHLQNDPAAKKARDYLAGRGIVPESYAKFGIGWAPEGWDNLLKHARGKSVKEDTLFRAGLVLQNQEGGYYDRFRGRVTFAIHNVSGQVVGFGARRIINDNSPKYINSPETDIYQKRQVLFNLHNARDSIREQDRVIIVEGYTDVTSMVQKDMNNTVATSGTALTPDHAALLHRYTQNVTLMFDGDSAGAAAAIRGADVLMQNGMEVSVCPLPQGQDPDDFCRQNNRETIQQTLNSAEPYVDYRLKHLQTLNNRDTVAQKSELTRDLLSTFARISDPIKQAFMVRDLAEKLEINETMLWQEIKKMSGRPIQTAVQPVQGKPVQDTAFFKTKRGAAEFGLLSTVFLQPELLDKILQNLDTAMLLHQEIRAFFDSFAANPVDPVRFDTTFYMSRIQDVYITKALSQLITTSEKAESGKLQKYAFECIITIQTAVVDQEIRNLKTKLQTAAPTDAEKLQENIIQLYSRKKEIAAGHYIDYQE